MLLLNVIILQSTVYSLIANKFSQYSSLFLSRNLFILVCSVSVLLVLKIQNMTLVSETVTCGFLFGK